MKKELFMDNEISDNVVKDLCLLVIFTSVNKRNKSKQKRVSNL